MSCTNKDSERDNAAHPLTTEDLDAVEARIEVIEKLYGIDELSSGRKIGWAQTMIIYWSDEDQCYLVSVPTLKKHVMNWNTLTHGDTYEEAARNGTEAIECALADDAATQPLGE